MILPLPPFIHVSAAATEEGRVRQDRRMLRDLAIMASATCLLVGLVLAYLAGPVVAISTIAGAAVLSVVGAFAMERWRVSASSVVLGAMGLVVAAFAGIALTSPIFG